MRTKIYFLRDENRFVRYVGKTTRILQDRLKGHLIDALHTKRNRRCIGIRAMFRRGFAPTIDLITEVEGDGCKAEIAYIKWLREKGIDLWNGTDGGDGVVDSTGEIGRKISLSKIGKKLPPLSAEHKRKVAEGVSRSWTPERRAEQSKLSTGRIMSITSRKKKSISMMGNKNGRGNKGQIPWLKGTKGLVHHSEESRIKMSLAKIGKPWSKAKRESWNRSHR